MAERGDFDYAELVTAFCTARDCAWRREVTWDELEEAEAAHAEHACPQPPAEKAP